MKRITKKHIFGFCIGVLLPLLVLPIVLGLWCVLANFEFSRIWYMFKLGGETQSRFICFSLFANLIAFYYIINRNRFQLGYGIIAGTFAYAPYFIYTNLF